MRNNRLPIYILIALALVAIIWRIANPPQPTPPGPVGMIPAWKSSAAIGQMGAGAVSPSGTMWAGAWNDDKVVPKTMRSEVLIIDLEKMDAKRVSLGKHFEAADLTWDGDTSVRVISVGPNGKSQLAVIDARTGSKRSLPGGLPEVMGITRGSLPVQDAVSADTTTVAAALATKGRGETYVCRSLNAPGASTQMFTSADLPGRFEGMWAAKQGVLVVVSERDKYHRMFWDSATGKLRELKAGDRSVDVAKTFPDAPKHMLFAAYSGGYDLDLQTGRTKKIISFDDLGKDSNRWRMQIQDGRLYPRKDGSYTAVSYAAGEVDIRVIEKDGSKGRDILVRR